MSTESQLREKLRRIEALFAGAGMAGEYASAGTIHDLCGDRCEGPLHMSENKNTLF